MPRPKKLRCVSDYPLMTTFIPEGVAVNGEVMLTLEEMEAIRLSDFEGLDQESAANLMKVSRQTYGRILANARSIVSEALVTGKKLIIDGGHYTLRSPERCRHRNRGSDTVLKQQGGIKMPRKDGTGPEGQGRGTGRGQGPCGQKNKISPTQGGTGSGSGAGRGKGGGRGRGGGGRGQGRGTNR